MTLAVAACSSDDAGTSEPSTDAGGDAERADDTGAVIEEDVSLVDVTVPSLPRSFELGLSVPHADADGEAAAVGWQWATSEADVVAIWLEGGLPWAEIVADESLPAEYEAFLASVAARAEATGRALLIGVDPLDRQRAGLAPDWQGREVAFGSFADPAVRDGYVRFCADLAARFEPRFFVPALEINAYAAGRPDDIDNLVEAYTDAREAIKLESRGSQVFPTFHFELLRRDHATRGEVALGMIRELDANIDRFALEFFPSDALRSQAELEPGGWDFALEATTRPLVVARTAYPARGFVRNGEVFPSSEESQFNFLAHVLDQSERVGARLVVWHPTADPSAWIDGGCEGAGCSPRLLERWEPFRQFGLVTADGVAREAVRLWRDFRTRPIQQD